VYGLETVRLRYFNVFGPRQSPDSPYAAVIPLFVQAMAAGRRPHIHGDGRQSRDFTYIADVIQANLLAAEAPGISGRVYNVACNGRTTLLELVTEINRLLGTNIEPVHGEPRSGDVRHSQADISRAQDDLGYRPSTDVARGIASYVKWYLERTSTTRLALSA
jgi:UDP-glucose 4-epimerase